MSARVLQEGSIGELPLVDLVVLAARAPHPAFLRLERADTCRDFYFRDGALVALATSNPFESLGSMLVRRQKVQQSMADTIRRLAEAERLSEAAVIMRDRVLPIPQLVHEMNLWAMLLLVQCFSWEDGTWQVVFESVDEQPPDALLEIGLGGALLKGVEKRMAIEMVQALLGPYRDLPVKRVKPPPFPVEGFEFQPAQNQFYKSLDGSRTVSEILKVTSLSPDHASRLLFTLLRMGMVQAVEAQAAAAPEAARSNDDDLMDLLDDLDALDNPPPAAPARPPPPPEPEQQDGPIDWSAISFRRREPGAVSRTGYAAKAGREEVAHTATGPVQVGVGIGHADSISQEMKAVGGPGPRVPTQTEGLGDLFDGVDLGGSPPTPPRSRPPKAAPPRGGRRSGGYSSRLSSPDEVSTDIGMEAAPAPEPEPVAKPKPAPPVSDDAPPKGAGPAIPLEHWTRLSTKDKERIRVLRAQLNKFKEDHYYECFGVPVDAPVGSIKKAYFQMAKRYHPDALLDEPPAFSVLAEALFAKYSEAYEILSDADARDKYTRKHVHGEKDEDDLAMERVQQILGAEGEFKQGLRLLNNGRTAQAIERFEAAVSMFGEEAEYLAYLGFALAKARTSPERAQDLLKQATDMKPGASKPWHLRGKAAIVNGDGKRAKAFLRKSLQIKPDDPEAVRDYRAADALTKSSSGKGKGKEESGGVFGGLFGRKKKKEEKPDDLDFDFDDLKL